MYEQRDSTRAREQISTNRGTAGLSATADNAALEALELRMPALHSLRWRLELRKWPLQRCAPACRQLITGFGAGAALHSLRWQCNARRRRLQPCLARLWTASYWI